MAAYVLTDAEEAIVAKGEAASLLLDNPTFLEVIEVLRAQCAEAILTSDPQARREREDAYNLSRGLSAITVELKTLETEAKRVIALAETQPDAEDHQPDVFPADY